MLITIKKIMLLFSVLLIDGCTSSDKPTSTDGNTVDTTTVDASIRAEEKNLSKHIDTSNWSYSEDEDKMTSKKTKYASVIADNILNFDFPYQGGSTSELVIRKNGSRVDIYVTVKPSQIIFDYDSKYVKVRFDDEKNKSWGVSQAADYSTDIFFFNSTPTFLSKLKKTKKLLVAVTFHNEGNQVIEFNTSGLKF